MMADNDDTAATPKVSQRDAQEALERQIAQLKREIGKINKTLAERVDDAAEEASAWYESASDRAARATRQLRTQAQSVSDTVQQNPGTVSAAFILGGAVGLLLGSLLGEAVQRDRRWF